MRSLRQYNPVAPKDAACQIVCETASQQPSVGCQTSSNMVLLGSASLIWQLVQSSPACPSDSSPPWLEAACNSHHTIERQAAALARPHSSVTLFTESGNSWTPWAAEHLQPIRLLRSYYVSPKHQYLLGDRGAHCLCEARRKSSKGTSSWWSFELAGLVGLQMLLALLRHLTWPASRTLDLLIIKPLQLDVQNCCSRVSSASLCKWMLLG